MVVGAAVVAGAVVAVVVGANVVATVVVVVVGFAAVVEAAPSEPLLVPQPATSTAKVRIASIRRISFPPQAQPSAAAVGGTYMLFSATERDRPERSAGREVAMLRRAVTSAGAAVSTHLRFTVTQSRT